jgi:hypothetical protein
LIRRVAWQVQRDDEVCNGRRLSLDCEREISTAQVALSPQQNGSGHPYFGNGLDDFTMKTEIGSYLLTYQRISASAFDARAIAIAGRAPVLRHDALALVCEVVA